MGLSVLLLVSFVVHVNGVFIQNYITWVSDAVLAKGYPCEVHSVISPDGYILNLHRIPRGPSAKSGPEKRPVVLLFHGMGSSSSGFVIGSTSKALGFLLADNGFDVWMADARGNLFSEKHVNMTKLDPAFWDFSWEEMAVKDIPAMLDYIRDQTGQEKLSYVGHSMGSTIFFAAMASNPELNSRIKVAALMAPSTSIGRTIAPLTRPLVPFARLIETILNKFGIYGIPYNPIVSWAIIFFCGINKDTEDICRINLSVLFGFDIEEFDRESYLIAAETHPSGVSGRSLVHYAQSIMTAKFRRYDFGPERNQKLYGQSSPPEFDLSKVTAPVALFYGVNDWLVHHEDVRDLEKKLPNLISSNEVDWPFFNHIDFILAKNVVPLVYDKLISILMNYR